MSRDVFVGLVVTTLFAGMLCLMEAGRRVGLHRLARDPEGARVGLGPLEASVFGLLGLLVAFTFSGAATRFQWRRDLVVEEANAIGTAWLRLDLLPAEAQGALRDGLRRYLDSRLSAYQKLPEEDAARAELARSARLQGEIWSAAVAACRSQASPATTTLLLSALNEMIDTTTRRTTATMAHPPGVIVAMLFGLGLGCSLLAGYGMPGAKARSWVHMILFAGILAVTIFVILDMEYPRTGLIRVDASDQVLVELRESMK